MLRPGMIVRTSDGRVMMLMGRNGCHQSFWWGYRLKPNGKPDKNTMPVVHGKDVVAVLKKEQGGFMGILPGIFG